MRRTMRKTMITVLTGVMLLSVTGCGKSDSDTGASSGPLTVADIQKRGKLTVATEVAYEPMEFYDENGKVTGYGKDILDYIVKDMGVELEQIDLPWQGMLAGLEAKKYDFVATSVSITPERAEKYSLTIPIADSTATLIKRKGDDSIQTVEDIEGKKVGTQNGGAYEEAIDAYSKKLIENGGKGISEKKLYTAFPEAYMELDNGSIDAVSMGYAIAQVEVMNNPDKYEIVGKIGDDTYFGWAVRKEDTEITEYINSEIQKMKADGTLAKAQEKWFGTAFDLPEDGYLPE